MKTNNMKLFSVGLIAALLLYTSMVFAQQERYHGNQAGKQQGGKREKMEVQRVAFISQELSLTPAEAKVFWPVYDEYDAKRHELKKSFRTNDLHKDEINKLTEKEASQILDNQIAEAQKLVDLRKEYHTKFKSVLPSVKVLKLYEAEREFQKMLIDKLRHNNPQAPAKNK